LNGLERVSVVLHRTRSAENAGSVARVCANMGLGNLVLVDPAGFDLVKARRLAAAYEDELARAEVAPALDDALDRFGFVVATSGRPAADRPVVDPTRAAEAALDAAARGSEVALVFGDERNGLPQAALDRADLVSHVPASPEAPSLNLAMAVLLHAWELRRLAIARDAEPPEPPPPMPEADLARLRRQAKALLAAAGYLNRDRPDKVLGELLRLLVRAGPTEREGRLLLALVRQLEWAVGH